jgi:hypothetical protein
MIIDAAGRGEDLGPTGALWRAAGASAAARSKRIGAAEIRLTVEPEAFTIMQALTNRGLPPATVLLLALRTAQASNLLAADLRELLNLDDQETDLEANDLGSDNVVIGDVDITDEALAVSSAATPPPRMTPGTHAAVIDLATAITRETLGHAL